MATKKHGIGSHESSKMKTDVWLTPPYIIDALGEFDMDPCSPTNRPWDTAKKHYTIFDDGLIQPWKGRIWMNPPYGKHTKRWMKKLAHHNNGIALIFARTETEAFTKYVWPMAHSIFFFENRLYFFTPEGKRASMNAGAPSCLIAYGENNTKAIIDSNLKGKLLLINQKPNNNNTQLDLF